MGVTGKFIISLDFELMWGVRDTQTTGTYGRNILGVRETLPKVLEMFNEYNISATFAIVGFLFAKSKEELLSYCPVNKPCYQDENLSPYNGYFDLVNVNEENDKYHFASSLVDEILKYPQHEIATHTFSHYYTLESGQTKDHFRDDLIAAKEIAKTKGVSFESIIFPRNQINEEYIEVLKELGIISYRGLRKIWDSKIFNNKAFRLIDSYLNIIGHSCYSIEDVAAKEPYNFLLSKFLRPYSSWLKAFEHLRLKRILNSMTYAAQNNKIYHLWWHPHNFGVNQNDNIEFLDKILKHYIHLNSEYGFESMTMKNLSSLIETMCVGDSIIQKE